MKKIGNSLWRKLLQIVAFGFCNFKVQNFFKGRIYSGKWKKFCAPGLNCYSCPAAVFSCPIGAAQTVASCAEFNFGFYVTGFLLAFGVIFGRFICGFLCPFGFFQELIFKIPLPKFRLPKFLKFVKYFILIFFVLILPAASTNFAGTGDPSFCKYICPVGTLEGALPLIFLNKDLRAVLGSLFILKVGILVLTVILCIFSFRFFCKTLCPLGAIYAILNKISFFHLNIDKKKCVNCGACQKACKMDCDPAKTTRPFECILCAECVKVCPKNALKITFFKD